MATKQQTGIWNAYPDLTGRRFGHLTVLRQVMGKTGRGKVWLCKCDCGNKLERTTNRLCFYGQEYCHGLTCPLIPHLTLTEKADRRRVHTRNWRSANREYYNALAHGYYQRNKVKKRARARELRDPKKDAIKDHKRVLSMPEEYVLKMLGTSRKDLPPEIIPTLVMVKRLQVQARRLVRSKRKDTE